MVASTRPASFDSADARYELVRSIGMGGAGEVYLAKDRSSGELIALKKLLRVNPQSVLQLKREFRALADLHHPNLIELYDLAHGHDAWFLTMEYLEGSDLLSYLGRAPTDSLECDVGATREGALHVNGSVSSQLIAAFQQLAHGVHALHCAGMLHRDLKPSNVMVENGRVVVLDFGLVRALDDAALTQDGLVSGTPAYMAPEQAAGGAVLDSGADWYAFGAMLYEALSGKLPIDARTTGELLARKTKVAAAPLRGRAADDLPELQDLCMRLLERDPALRPRGEEVLAAFARASRQPANQVAHPRMSLAADTPDSQLRARETPAPLFGRRAALLQLTEALDSACRGQAVLVHVAGASGMGKSTLVEQFLSGLDDSQHWLLRSRCYERESIPFKALDGLLDALVRQLSKLDDLDVGHLLPSDVAALAQLFPMLERLSAVQRLLEREQAQTHAVALRQRAELALGELFARLAARQPLVIWIDDLHWGDLDSVSILQAWRSQLAAACVLIVISYRSDETETSPCLAKLLAPEARSSLADGERVPARALEQHLQLDALGAQDVRSLCEARLGALASDYPQLVAQIADESLGNPFLVAQLAALAEAELARGDGDLTALSVEQWVAKASALLPPAARELLHVLALAERPVPPTLALQAAGVTQDGRSQLHALRGLQLIRSRDVHGAQLVEVYHDRVREGIRQYLTPAERETLHGKLLQAALAHDPADVAWLHTLALGAGKREPALRYGLAAAARASTALAFEHAVQLYQTCLELSQDDGPERAELWQKLAFALGCNRQGVRAAEAYLEAAKLAPAAEAVPLLQLAASHFVRSGEFERGEALMHQVFARLRLDLPESSAGLLAAIAWERTRIKLRGRDFSARTEAEVPAEELRKIDLFAELSIENQAHHPLRAALLEARCLRWSLSAGEPRRVGRALCLSAISSCVSGTAAAAARSDALLARAARLAEETQYEPLRGQVFASRAICASLLGRLRDVCEPAHEAERIYQRVPEGGNYYLRVAMVATRIGSLVALGELRSAAVELRRTLGDAHATGNRSASLHLTLAQVLVDETEQRVQRSRARLLTERAMLPKQSFGTLHTLHMLAVMRTASWLGDYDWAEPFVREDWPRWQRSPVRLSAFISLLALACHARYLLNRHVARGDAGDPAALLRPDMRAMNRLQPAWRIGSRARSEARLAFLSGQPLRAAELLRSVAEVAEGEGAVTEAARDRHALGMIVGGSEGSALVRHSQQFLRDRGMVDPIADLRANYPELLLR